MKRILTLALFFLGILFISPSCQKAPFVTLNTPRSYTFTRDGGSQSITFTCNRAWSVSSSESWISVSPSSGTASDGEVTVKISCAANTTYDPRSATVTIKVEELSEAVSISQDTGMGLIVSPKTLELTNAEQTIEIEVQKNIQYSISIDDAGKSWITYTGTKGLTSEKATFSIAANEIYDNREAKITFKQTDGSLSETVVVKQSQMDAILATCTEYSLSNEAQSISIEVNANVEYNVSSEVEWIHYVETKALSSSTVVLSVDANSTSYSRKGQIKIIGKDGIVQETILINQEGKERPKAPDAVDLGLSVKWASFNVGASKPEEYGDYFAWGETEPYYEVGYASENPGTHWKSGKTGYDWASYKWCDGSYISLTKYNTNSSYGTVDNKPILEDADDAARANLGGKWRTPTDAEWTELLENCTWTWTSNYNGTGIAGRVVTGNKAGYTDKSIFLPAAGCRVAADLSDVGSHGYYWSSSLYTGRPYFACLLYFDSSDVGMYIGSYRSDGLSVRPVNGDRIHPEGVTLSQSSLSLYEGRSAQLSATVQPDDATDKSVVWSSSNVEVASVSQNGTVTGVGVGTAIITTTTNDGGLTASCEVTVVPSPLTVPVPDAVDLGLSVKWATFNVGASKPEEYGDYFAWGETAPKSDYTWTSYKWCNGFENSLTKYNTDSFYGNVDNKTVLEDADDAARANLGGNWRTPTDTEWTELLENCTWTWTDNYNGTGVAGKVVTSNKAGYTDKSIFLPAVGYLNNTNLFHVGSNGVYWSSSLIWSSPLCQDDPSRAWNLYFDSVNVYMSSSYRCVGRSVRPVSE